jgi:hypothetical protein
MNQYLEGRLDSQRALRLQKLLIESPVMLEKLKLLKKERSTISSKIPDLSLSEEGLDRADEVLREFHQAKGSLKVAFLNFLRTLKSKAAWKSFWNDSTICILLRDPAVLLSSLLFIGLLIFY